LVAAATVAISANSCSSRAKVSGSVTFQNKPLPAGRVTFIGANGKSSDPVSIESGQYEVSNAPVGECKIKVETLYLAQSLGIGQMPGGVGMPGMGPAGTKFAEKGMGKEALEKLNPNPDFAKMKEQAIGLFVEIPPDYADPDKTPLTFTVKSGSNRHDIELVAPPGWQPRLKK
jgi:hypothetical protein